MRFLEGLIGGQLTFGGHLSAIRKGEGMTLDAFAKQLEISRQHLCDIEKRRRMVSVERAAKWAHLLGYSETLFVRLALQDMIEQAGLNMKVSIDAA
jgi:transcriptional regulator with XRE-family HTH domain